jgi:hypothetical protein
LEKIYNIFGIISVLIVYVLPLFILAFLNARIIMRLRVRPFTVKLVNSQKHVEMSHLKSRTPGAESAHPKTKQSITVCQSNFSKNDRNLSITLVMVAVTFMILTFPFQAYWFFENFFKTFLVTTENVNNVEQMLKLNQNISLSEYNYDESHNAQENKVNLREVTFAIKNLNYLINFFLYSALSKLFRQEFFALITRKNTSSPIPSDHLLTSSIRSASQKKRNNSSLTRVSFSMKALKDLPNRNSKKCYLQIKIEPSNFFNYFRKNESKSSKMTIKNEDKGISNRTSGEQSSSVLRDNGKVLGSAESEPNIIKPVRTMVKTYRERSSSSSVMKNFST